MFDNNADKNMCAQYLFDIGTESSVLHMQHKHI